MSASVKSSKGPGLLSARNLILAAAAVFVLSVLGMCVSMLQPNDSGGMGRDSYGTRVHGYRAVMEVLAELGVPVARDLAPPHVDAKDEHTLVLLGPEPRLVQFSPKYLQSLLSWIDAGGRLVIAPSPRGHRRGDVEEEDEAEDRETEDKSPRDILELLGLSEQFQLRIVSQAADEDTANDSEAQEGWASPYDYLPEDLVGTLRSDAGPPHILKVKCAGTLLPLADAVRELAIPAEGFAALSAESTDALGSLSCIDQLNNEHLLVAVVRRGAGEIVLVSEPSLWNNRLVSEADNSVLAAHLLAPKGQEVVFDEFYHGLAVRGNALYLLTLPGFAAVSVGLLLSVGAWTWRSAMFLGPPLSDREPSRRDISEYIDAMGSFFCRGPGHRKFLVRETRDGVLWQLCRELNLPLDTPDIGVISAALRRHNPRRAARLDRLLSEVDAALAAPREYPKAKFLPSLQGLVGCL
jgi:hypothetical protein